jgi:hypothetical protein
MKNLNWKTNFWIKTENSDLPSLTPEMLKDLVKPINASQLELFEQKIHIGLSRKLKVYEDEGMFYVFDASPDGTRMWFCFRFKTQDVFVWSINANKWRLIG